MAYEADRVVVELIAKTDQMDTPVKQSATQFDASMNKIVASATKAETAVAKSSAARSAALQRESAQISQFSRILSRDMDVAGAHLTSASSPFVVPVKQAPAVSNAMKLVSTGAGLLGGVFGGVLAGGVALAVSALVEFIAKSRGTSAEIADMVEKLKEAAEKTDLARRAQAIYATTLEGVTEALDALDKIQKQLNDSTKTTTFLALQAASAAKARLELIRTETLALIDQAKAQIEVTRAQAQQSGSMRDSGAAAEQRFAENRLEALRKRAEATNAQIDRAQQKIIDFSSRLAVEVASRDPAERINKRYDDLIETMRQRLKGEKDATAEIAKQTVLLIKQRDAELAALKTKKQRASASGEFGRQISFSDARAIAESAGLSVTSAYRSTAKQAQLFNDPSVNRPGNPVARPGTSAHEGVRGKWALDIAFAPGLTAGKIKKVFGDQGVALSAVFKEKGHFHIEGSRSQAAAQERLASRLAEEEKRRAQAFANEKAGLEDQVIDARQALALSAADVADFERQAVEAARLKYEQNVKALQEQGRLLPREAAELLKLNDERAKLRQELVNRREAEQRFREQEAAFRRAADFQDANIKTETDLLQSREAIATTAKERHALEDRMLDLQFLEERLHNEYIINWAERVKASKTATEAEKADAALAEEIAKRNLGTSEERRSNARTSNDRSNAGPLGDFFNSIPDTADQINEALENVAANGLATFTDALTNAIVNFTSLGDVGRAVLQGLTADLVKLAIQQILLHTVGKALGLTAIATTTAAAAAAGAAWAGPAALASLATLGANAGPAAAALASTTALATVLGAPKAGGGRILGAGSDTSDNILTPTSPNEFVIRASSARNIGYSALQYMNQHGRLPGGMAEGGVVRPMNVPAAGASGRGGFSPDDIRQLRGIVGDAIAAQPDINLFPTFDPVAAFGQVLNSKRGRSIMFDFMSANAGGVNAQLR